MANLGRFACVALPFALTLASLIALLVAGLGGVTDKSLYMFQVDLTNLSISPATIQNAITSVTSRDLVEKRVNFHDATLVERAADDVVSQVEDLVSNGSTADEVASAVQSSNITAADLGLDDLYNVGLWGYCTVSSDDTTCTKPAFDWATQILTSTTSDVNSLISTTGQNITLPDEITSAINTFSTVIRWTQIVFIIAYIALAVELIFGILSNCSRGFSCITTIVSLLATIAVCGAAALSTATAVVVVGTVESTAQFYGVSADFNNRFLATVWIAAAFAITAGLFWSFTMCCCKPDHSSHRRRNKLLDSESEKAAAIGTYRPLSDSSFHSQRSHGPAPQNYGQPVRSSAYEPYSHTNV